jgi:hypothetical protein
MKRMCVQGREGERKEEKRGREREREREREKKKMFCQRSKVSGPNTSLKMERK